MRGWIDNAALFLARLGPAGLSPKAPGTVGSACAVVTAPWLFLPLSPLLRLLLLALLFGIGSWAATRAERVLARKDPSSIVVDELVGQWITLLPLQAVSVAPGIFDVFGGLDPLIGPASGQISVFLLLIGFCLFRLFDIWKPGPVRASETWLPGGYGVMIDDVVAGLFAMLVLIAMLICLSLTAG